MKPRPFKLLCTLGLLAAGGLCSSSDADANPAIETVRRSVVKIYVTIQREDYLSPWQGGRTASATGSGFVIKGKRILTNAHVVSDARFLQVQKDGDPRRYEATVDFAGHDCDLAALKVADDSFFDNTTPVDFAEQIPSLNDEVLAIGYPLGGDRLSITKGIVSRIDYSGYSHSGVDQHLVLQVDAAINPGNSGGPVLFKDRIVGLAFQGIQMAQNIGYVIPVPVIRHFLTDIVDGRYDGYPELGVHFLDTRNEALRQDLKLSPKQTGVVVYYVDPFGSARDTLKPRDVLLSIDGHAIANDGNVSLDGNPMVFNELLERKQWGDAVVFQIWRDAGEVRVEVPLKNPPDPFIYRNLYDEKARYYILGGLVFAPLNREYLDAVAKKPADADAQQLFYYSQYAKVDGLHTNVDEFVVLIKRLPHPVNTYADGFVDGLVTRVNGTPIRGLGDIKAAATASTNRFHVIEFAGMEDSLILDVPVTRAADPRIFATYGIPSGEYMGEPK